VTQSSELDQQPVLKMTEPQSSKFSCPVSAVRVTVWHQYLGSVSGIGDARSTPQYDYQCEREATCAATGLTLRCPLNRLR
jgi:hypothetical protein